MLSFVLDFLLCVALIYLPGLILLALMRCNLLSTVTLAPLPTLAYYGVASEALALAHIPASAFTIAGSCLVIFFLLGLLINRIKKHPCQLLFINHDSLQLPRGLRVPFSLVALGLFLCVGLGFYSYLFCRNAGSPDMFLQNYDNVTHLARIRLFDDTGSFSSLGAGMYDLAQDPATRPTTSTGSFYPSLWHAIGAMVFGIFGGSVPTLVNALNGVFVAIVFPLSMLALLSALFPNKPKVILCGALATIAFEAFPWGYLTFGPLYPNLASLAILPAVWAVFILAFRNATYTNARAFSWALLMCGVIALLFLQPNALFTSIIGLTPFCVYKILKEPPAWQLFNSKTKRRLVALVFIVFVVAFWLICYNLPFFAGVVSFDNWRAIASKRQVLIDVLTLALSDCPAELWLGALVIIGCVAAWRDQHLRWIVVSYGLFAVFYAVCASFEGTLKHLLCGFWYCDPFRLAAHMVFFGSPLAALGLVSCIEFLRKRITSAMAMQNTPRSSRRRERRRLSDQTAATLIVVAASVILLFYPNFSIKGVVDIHTAFGFFEEKVQDCADDSLESQKMLPVDEQRFLEKVAELVDDDALIINNPYDGSVFAYGLNGLNTYYRYVIDYGLSDETEASLTIRDQLNELSSNAYAAKALLSTGADYLLLLDVNNPKMKNQAFDTYQPKEWEGLTKINDSTEGFIPILSEGDMRLYRIDPTKVNPTGAQSKDADTQTPAEHFPIGTEPENSETGSTENTSAPDSTGELEPIS